MTSRITLIALVVGIIVAALTAAPADAHRPGRHTAGTLVAPKLHWLGYLRAQTDEEHAARCRPEPRRQWDPVYEVPAYARTFTIRIELGRLTKARGLASRCELALAWAWYRTSSTQCVVNGEGWWTTNTGNGYYGRFQADTSFAKTYNPAAARAHGPYAYAPAWSPSEQVLMGYRGWRARGYSPWPTTGRRCGLI